MKHNTKEKQIRRDRDIIRLEQMLIRGISNQKELGNAFGVSQPIIHKRIRQIEEKWREHDQKDMDDQRRLRTKQIDAIAVMAWNAFERSRQDAEEFSITDRRCNNCSGDGKIEKRPNEFDECIECGGRGKITIETTRVKGQAGDSSFLKVALACFSENAKLNGLYPRTGAQRSLLMESREVGGVIQTRVEELYFEAPVDMIIKAKAMIDELKRNMKQGEVRIIESEATEVEGNGEEQ